MIVTIPLLIIFLLILAWKNENKLSQEIYKRLFGVLYEDFGNKKVQGL
jgi:hypothetical protein